MSNRSGPIVTADRVTLRRPLSGPVAILVDDAVRAILPAGPGLDWAFPHDLFGRLLDIIDTGSGASLLAAPVPLEPHRRIEWLDAALDGLAVRVAFRVHGPRPSGLPIAVEMVAGAIAYARGFAHETACICGARLPLDRLPPGEDSLVLRPRFGAMVLETPITLDAAEIGVVGYLDEVSPWRVCGWAMRRDGDGPLAVGLFVAGRLLATAQAEVVRADVAQARGGDGRCGFAIAVPAGARAAGRVDVRLLPDGPSLVGSPAAVPSAPELAGHFDGMDGLYVGGWALHPGEAAPVRVEAVCDGAVVGEAMADHFRADVAAAGLPTARCGFHFALTAPTVSLLGRDISVRVAGTDWLLPGSPVRFAASPALAAFLDRGRALRPGVLDRFRRRSAHRTRGMLLSLILPAHETRPEWLEAAVESVRVQWCGNWELIAIDDGSRTRPVFAALQRHARADGRIRALRSEVNVGIARAVNYGIRAATGDYVAVLDHDDALEPDAVHHMLAAARETGADLLYSDEVLTGAGLDQLLALRARPAWSHDYYLSHPYFVHLVAMRRELAQKIGGWDERLSISADVDAVLRASELARVITHVPRVLYRWRTHAGSAGHRSRSSVMAATSGAIARHLQRTGHAAARVSAGFGFNQFRVDWPDDCGSVLAVIPTKDQLGLLRSCIASLERTTSGRNVRVLVIDHQSEEAATRRYLRELAARHTVMSYRGPFHYARMNNLAVRHHAADAAYLLFLNNDVEAIAAGWLERLRSLAGRPEVGAVGPMLLYGNGRVQHAGVLVPFGEGADHAMRFADPVGSDGARNPGYNDNLVSTRDYSAVTAACLLMRRDVFLQVGGFDERFAIGYNDTDLCLRVREAGYRVLYDGQTQLIHHESATRSTDRRLIDPEGDDALLRARWPGYFRDGDPFYSPLLTQSGRDHQVRDTAPGPVRYRATRLQD